jgi:hypothetical protein
MKGNTHSEKDYIFYLKFLPPERISVCLQEWEEGLTGFPKSSKVSWPLKPTEWHLQLQNKKQKSFWKV